MNPLVVIIQFVQVGIRPIVQHSPRGAVNHGSKIQLAQRCRVIKDGTDIATLVVTGAVVITLLSKYLRDRIGIEQLTRNYGAQSYSHHRKRYYQYSPRTITLANPIHGTL